MFTTFDDLRDFALTFVDEPIIENITSSDIDDKYQIYEALIKHFLDKFKQDDCLIPGNQEEFEIEDYNKDYGVTFISSGGIPLGIFTVFQDDDYDEPRFYVSINHNVTYLDEHNIT